MGVLSPPMSMHNVCIWCYQCQKRMLDALGLELQTAEAVSHYVDAWN